MIIRNVEAADLADLVPLSSLVNQMHAQAYPAIYKPIPAETILNMMNEKLINAQVIFRLAAIGPCAVGYYCAKVRDIAENEYVRAYRCIYLDEIMVDPDVRGSGVGGALIADIKHITLEKRIDRIELDVSGFNTVAQTFFKKQGFELQRQRLSIELDT